MYKVHTNHLWTHERHLSKPKISSTEQIVLIAVNAISGEFSLPMTDMANQHMFNKNQL